MVNSPDIAYHCTSLFIDGLAMSDDLNAFREEVSAWLKENFPSSLKGIPMGLEGEAGDAQAADFELWRQRLADKGWGAPTWPTRS